MFYKRKKVVHLNFRDTTKEHKDAKAVNAAKATKDIKEPKEEHVLRLKFEKNMRKLFGMNTMYKNKI
jgi:hypothetical protein